MKPKKAIKELRKQLKGDPGNVVVKIRLASLLRDVNEYGEAVHLYLAVAQSYLATERLGQAIAVCKGILEFAPQDPGAHQMLAYLERSRIPSDSIEEQAQVPAVPRYSSPPPDGARRKRPTSYPTPLSDGGPGSPLPGAPPTPRGVPGRLQRLQPPTEPPGALGVQRNTRPADTMGHTLNLSPRGHEPDATVPGAPPTRPTNEFKLRDLSAAGSARIADAADLDEGLTQRKIPRLGGPPKLPLSRSPRMAGVPTPPPLVPHPVETGTHTVPRGRSISPGYEPPVLAPAPTPAPRDAMPPPPLRGRDEPSDDTDEPGLEDATIVDANFDMAKFILSQGPAEQDPSDADLPEIPGRQTAPPARHETEEVTRIAEPEPLGVLVDQLGALRRLPDYALRALAAGARENTYPPRYTVLSEGDANDTCYLLLAGGLQVLKRNPMQPDAAPTEAARLLPGALFGEYAMVGDRRCLASVQTRMPSTVIEIPRTCIADLTSRFPGLRPSLEILYRDILIESLMSSSSVFTVLSQDEWPEVLGAFEPVRATTGQSIIKAGERFGGFYLVLTGELSVHDPQGGVIRGLGAGFYFGEVSMLRGELARATVTAESTVELARLDARRFYKLVAGNERLWAHIWKEMQQPGLANLQLVAGVAANI